MGLIKAFYSTPNGYRPLRRDRMRLLWKNKQTNKQSDLEDEFSQYSFAQVQSSVDDHGAELDEQHHQEGLGNLVL